MRKPKCIVEECEKKASARGLCSPCYAMAKSYIKHAKTTWKELEEMKLATSTRKTKVTAFAQAFADKLAK